MIIQRAYSNHGAKTHKRNRGSINQTVPCQSSTINLNRCFSHKDNHMPSGDESDQENRENRHSNSALSNNSSGLNCFRSWSIVNEIGDGACLLRCIAHHVVDNPLFHFIVRHQLINRMSQHMHDIIPGSGGNTFNQAITTGTNEEYIKISGSPQSHYHSLDHYLQLMVNPSTCATHT